MSYEIIRHEDGTCVAKNQKLTITVQPTRADRCRMFRRNRIHLNSAGKRTQLLVAEIDGVFLYVNGDEFTLTRKIDV